MKPLFRWTMYETSRQGLEIFIEAICRTPLALGKDKFDWAVTFNGSEAFFRTIENSIKLAPVPITLINQKIEDCPIPTDGPPLGMWKVCPPRLRIDAPEIICDNDLIFVRNFPKIEEFIETGKPLLVKDPIRFYGHLDRLHPHGENWNSGLLTLPPNYDFSLNIKKEWELAGSPKRIGYAEEQALLTRVIRKLNPTFVEFDEIVELNKNGIPNKPRVAYVPNGKEYGFHFVESNRHYHKEAIAFLNRSNPPAPIPMY